jgi:hypothetical protein
MQLPLPGDPSRVRDRRRAPSPLQALRVAFSYGDIVERGAATIAELRADLRGWAPG